MSVDAPIRPTADDAKAVSVGVQTLSESELDALIERIAEARAHNLALSAADYDVLLNAIMTLANMQERLSHNDLTLSRLKKLLGMVNSSEKLKDLRPKTGDKGNKCSSAKRGRTTKKAARKRGPRAPSIKPTVHHHPMEGLSRGDRSNRCRDHARP